MQIKQVQKGTVDLMVLMKDTEINSIAALYVMLRHAKAAEIGRRVLRICDLARLGSGCLRDLRTNKPKAATKECWNKLRDTGDDTSANVT